jgi:hypothetical protein
MHKFQALKKIIFTVYGIVGMEDPYIWGPEK